MSQKTNRGIVYLGPGKVQVKEIPYPNFDKFTKLDGTVVEVQHGVIVKTILTNICGSDAHMARGRTTAQPGFVFGHEITGEVVEVGQKVSLLKAGDLVSVPFNIACGCCENCNKGFTNICINEFINSKQIGGAYGFADMGGWPGGQANYVLVPFADFNCLKLPDREITMPKLLDIAVLSDIFPTGFNAAVQAKVGVGSSVYIAGAGPVGTCCAASCAILLGAGHVFVGDYQVERLEQIGKNLRVIPIDLNKVKDPSTVIQKVTGKPFVDCAIDCAGFETCGSHGHDRHSPEERAEVLNTLMKLSKPAGNMSIPGIYTTVDPGATDNFDKQGGLMLKWGEAWVKGLSISQGQCPVKQWNRQLLNCILSGAVSLVDALNVTVIPLDKAPEAYDAFDKGEPRKFILDPNNVWSQYKGLSSWSYTRK